MEYCLNEKDPYRYQDVIACFHTFEDTCILQGVVRWDKKLIISKEKHFTNASKNEVANFLKFTSKPWVNKNPYFLDTLKGCYYCLDFADEEDLAMLEDGMKELLYNNRLIYAAEKSQTKNRDKCLQMVVKALNHYLNKNSISISFSTGGNDFFPHPATICYSECGADSISNDVEDYKVKLPERKISHMTRLLFESRLKDTGHQYASSKSGSIEKITRSYPIFENGLWRY